MISKENMSEIWIFRNIHYSPLKLMYPQNIVIQVMAKYHQQYDYNMVWYGNIDKNTITALWLYKIETGFDVRATLVKKLKFLKQKLKLGNVG